MAATYTYDALGRRIGIDDGGTQTWTVYNGKTADDNPYSDFNSSGGLKTRYVDGLAVDELLARTDSSGNVAWYLTDQLGSVAEIDSKTGSVLDQIIYDPYGNIVTQTNATNGDRFMFAGMEYDSTTGIYYDHARNYNSVVGRFVSQDPMGFKGGDTNLYRYVANDPTYRADPSGMVWWLPDIYLEGQTRRGTGWPWIAGPNNDSGHHAWTAFNFESYAPGSGIGIIAAVVENGRELFSPAQKPDAPGDIIGNTVGGVLGTALGLTSVGKVYFILPKPLLYWASDYIWGTSPKHAKEDD